MTAWRIVLSRIRATFLGVHSDAELSEEIGAHIDLLVAEHIRQGMSPEAARVAARRRFGGVEQIKEEYRHQRGVSWLEDLGRDVVQTCRTLNRAPGLFVVVIITLALGIGANTAISSVVDSLLLRTLPVVEPERLAVLATGDRAGRELRTWPHGVWEQIRLRGDLFDGAVAWSTVQPLTVSHAGGDGEPVEALFVSGDFFDSLGIRPLIGRSLTAADDVRGGGREGAVAVISAALWQRRFGGVATVVGAPLAIEGIPFTIVGVAPSQFMGAEVGRSFDVAIPIGAEPLVRDENSMIDDGGYWLRIMLRLKPGQSSDVAAALLRSMQPQIATAAFPESRKVFRDDFLKQPFVVVPAAAGVSRLRYEYERPLLALQLLAALVLLIACANVANLLLAHALNRQHELRIRLALGAPRSRVARQLLAESLVLAVCGGTAGLVIAVWASRALVAQLSTPLTPVALDVSLDWRVAGFTLATSLATVVLFGTAVALRAARLAPVEALKQNPFSDPADVKPPSTPRPPRLVERRSWNSRMTLPGSLVVGQVALSVILLIAAGLLVRTLTSLGIRPVGFDRDRVLIVNVGAQRTGIEPGGRVALYQRARAAVRSVPGVAAAAISHIVPFNGVGYFGPDFHVSGPSVRLQNDTAARSYANVISPGWFDTMGTPLIAGRDFTGDDRRGTRPVVIVNETWARTFLDGASSLGHTITLAPNMPFSQLPMEIVGLVADSALVSLRDPAPPTMYMPFGQFDLGPGSMGSVSVVVRSESRSPALLTRSLSAAFAEVNPDLVLKYRPLGDHLDAALARERLVAALSSVFGGLAVLLAALGVYGITAYAAARRRHEIGIRMALGARRREVLALVLARSVAMTALGLVLGVAGAAALTRYLESMLFGLTPLDPATFLGAALLFVIVSAVAAYVPARRATRMDPLVALGMR